MLPPRAAAQGAPGVRVDLAAAQGTRVPAVSATHILDDPPLQELMHNGFPVELNFRLELWRSGGMFNHLESSTHWEVLVQYLPDPYRPAYRILRRDGKQSEDFGAITSLDSAQAVLAQPYRVRLAPSHKGERYYYNVVLEVESLNASDLGELERWVHGDLRPAVKGSGNPLSALRNGIGRLLSRVLGGTHRSYEATSPTFVAGEK
jgi:hypothetical protein